MVIFYKISSTLYHTTETLRVKESSWANLGEHHIKYYSGVYQIACEFWIITPLNIAYFLIVY